MTKKQFLQSMDSVLRKLPDGERQDILRDYDEHFEIGMKDGKSEQEIAAAFGSPEQLAKELLAEYHMEKAERSATAGNLLRAVIAVISLGFFNLIFVLVFIIAIAAIILIGWTSGLALVLSPLFVIIGAIINTATFELFALLFSLCLCGLGLLLLMGMRVVTKFFAKALIRYLNFNIKIVKGGNSGE